MLFEKEVTITIQLFDDTCGDWMWEHCEHLRDNYCGLFGDTLRGETRGKKFRYYRCKKYFKATKKGESKL